MLLGKEKGKGLAHQVVMELVSPLSNMGYRVYTDNLLITYLFLRFKTKDLMHVGQLERTGMDLVRHLIQQA